MEYVNTQGAEVPVIGLGTWQLTGPRCTRVVEAALDLGYRHIDTAEAYDNEGDVGRGLAQAERYGGATRDDVWVTTKISLDHARYDDTLHYARDCIRRLGVDYVDLLLLHWPNPEVPFTETLDALQRLQDEGLVRYFGVSNFTVSMTEAALRSGPILGTQVECHPYLQQKELHSLALARKLLFTAYSPLARGEVNRDETLKRIGAEYGKSPAQVTLRWLIQRGNVVAIPKASSTEHLQSNLGIFDFQLTDAQMQTIGAMGDPPRRMVDPPWAPQWEST